MAEEMTAKPTGRKQPILARKSGSGSLAASCKRPAQCARSWLHQHPLAASGGGMKIKATAKRRKSEA